MRTAAPRVSRAWLGAVPHTQAATGRASGPGRSAVRGRRVGWGWGLRPPASGPRPGHCGATSLAGGLAWGPLSLASADKRGRTFPAPPPTPQSEGGGQLDARPPHPHPSSQYPNGRASLGWQEGCGGGWQGLGGGGECGFVLSQCHPRVLHLLLAWSSGPLGWQRARGRDLGRWAGWRWGWAWILFPLEQMRG